MLLDIVVPTETVEKLKCIFLIMEYIPKTIKQVLENDWQGDREQN